MENENQTPMPPMWWKDGSYDYPVEGGIEISGELWQALFDGQSEGKMIMTGEDGYPYLADSPAPSLEEHRAMKIAELDAHDHSTAVNSFRIGDAELWLDKATRSSLHGTLNAEAAAGRTHTTIWYGSEPPKAIEIGIDKSLEILADVEIYASEVFNVTQRHKAAIYALDTVEAVKAYDHTAGYPDRLHFTA